MVVHCFLSLIVLQSFDGEERELVALLCLSSQCLVTVMAVAVP